MRILEKIEIPILDEIILEENENEPRRSTSLLYVLDRINSTPHYSKPRRWALFGAEE